MTAEQLEKLHEIRRLLDEAYADWHARADDHHCKGSEGYVEVYYPNWFAVRDGQRDPCIASGLGIYSYVLGPYRMHHFYEGEAHQNSRGSSAHFSADPFATALASVRKWHAQQLAQDYEADA